MVKLLIGHKGSGKTAQMIQLANDGVEKSNWKHNIHKQESETYVRTDT